MSASAQLDEIARRAVDDLLAADPVGATWLGDHRFDDLLPDLSASAQATLAARIEDHLTALDALDDLELDVDGQVDLEILRAALTRTRFEATELAAARWNPMAWNPGTGIYLLLSRDVAPEAERIASARARVAAIPDLLASARAELGDMPAIHVETALSQFAGTSALVAQVEPDGPALRAIEEFCAWLAAELPSARRSPRLGERLYAAQLWHSLDDPRSAASLLEDANAHLDEVTTRMREVASAYLGEEQSSGVVPRALARIAAEHPVTDATVLPLVAEAVARTRAFVVERGIVTMPAIDVDVIEMPEIHRGVAVAYCDAPGPLEQASLPTRVAVSPTPAGWDAARIASFYREYNGIQLHDLTIHEAFPGHVLQLAHARVVQRPLRRYGFNGPFVEGWAVYAEECMVDAGYAPAGDDAGRLSLALRLQQLKMQARMTINAILDIRVHCMDMTEEEGMSLMTRRGFQEEGEATGKWRRAQLTAGQLPTYFAGYRAVSAIAADLRVLHPDWTQAQLHDLMLGHGSIAPRHLRTLLGI